jgi:hypothetical protein
MEKIKLNGNGNIPVYVKKIFNGTDIDIRDYYVNQAIEDNVNVEVSCEKFNYTSVYTPKELRLPLRRQGNNGKPFISKFEGEPPYFLKVYKWKNNN